MNIKEFKQGDRVTRVEPTKITGTFYNPFTSQTEERGGDCSYIGEMLTFIGIANGCAYFDRVDGSFMAKITGTTKLDLRLLEFSGGWDYWKDIKDIGKNNDDMLIKYNLKEELENLIADENYKLIDELKDIFDTVISNTK